MGELGSEEVLLCACDDGDVVGYMLRAIIRRIEDARFEESKPIRSFSPKPLNPFLLHNVGASAWGLAIHQAARMIAVSANTHNITVFAFALDKAENSKEDDSGPGKFPAECLRIFKNNDLLDRTRHNLIMQLAGHSTNIPNLSFCNLPGDATGKYLLSADIDGMVILWDVWNQTKLQWHEMKTPADQFTM